MENLALYLSVGMAVFLFAVSYMEAIRISNSKGKVYGGTFIFSTMAGLVFSRLSYLFI
ncbi:hypothetical protein ACQCT6_19970 [Cytobacillus gottheilii]|uniref:Uncharacterized protein n=1 Tax=Cytobacillus gottheilii TaxID=859144 RepID=A0ABX8F9Y7_9BACI|nr:hypothetical protein [Cytobacillus gottheilii]QVY60819.1 hypothetical protein J1899_17825 [Cytobacillus gottheilii]